MTRLLTSASDTVSPVICENAAETIAVPTKPGLSRKPLQEGPDYCVPPDGLAGGGLVVPLGLLCGTAPGGDALFGVCIAPVSVG